MGAVLPRLIFKCSSHQDQDNKHQNDKYLTLKGFVVKEEEARTVGQIFKQI